LDRVKKTNEVNDDLPVYVYTDGACRGNPGPGGWGLRILYQDGRVLEAGGAARDTTNNRMELSAAVKALELTAQEPNVVVVTDSEYVRQGITSWLAGWKRRGWKTVKGDPVLNRDLWEELSRCLRPHVVWEYVAGHSGDRDNERCDRIAVAFAEGRPIDLADGSCLEDPPGRRVFNRARSAKKKRKRRANTPGQYYLSLVDGVLTRHATWAECEAIVKGRSGARYKKCADRDEEREILDSWGVPTDRR